MEYPSHLLMADNVSTTGSILTNGRKKKGRARRRHSVDFVSHTNIVEIEKTDESVKEDMWYSKEEYDLIKTRNSLVVKMMKNGQFEESEEFSIRGLEHKLREGKQQRMDNKFGGLNAVLIEQDRQYAKGKSNLDSIATKYEQVTNDAKDLAVCNALLDAADSYSRVDGTPLLIVTGDDDDDDNQSVVSDIESVMTESEDWYEKKMKLQAIFKNVSARKKDKLRRRASL